MKLYYIFKLAILIATTIIRHIAEAADIGEYSIDICPIFKTDTKFKFKRR